MKKILLVTVLVFAVLALGLAAYAEEAEDDISAGTNHADKYMGKKDKIGLSDEQVKKLKEVKENVGKKNAELVKLRNDIRKEIKALMQAEEIDLAKVESKVKDLEKVSTQIMMNKLSGAKDASKVLTKEQKEKAKSMKEGKVKSTTKTKGKTR